MGSKSFFYSRMPTDNCRGNDGESPSQQQLVQARLIRGCWEQCTKLYKEQGIFIVSTDHFVKNLGVLGGSVG